MIIYDFESTTPETNAKVNRDKDVKDVATMLPKKKKKDVITDEVNI